MYLVCLSVCQSVGAYVCLSLRSSKVVTHKIAFQSNRTYRHAFRSCSDLDLHSMTLAYELGLDLPKMYQRTNNEVSRSRLLKVSDRTRHTDRQTDATECITTPNSWVSQINTGLILKLRNKLDIVGLSVIGTIYLSVAQIQTKSMTQADKQTYKERDE